MKRTRILRTFMFAAFWGTLVLMFNSCTKDDPSGKEVGTVSGLVTDELGMPVTDVKTVISGVDGSVTSAADGKYVVEKVSIESHTITFSKDGYKTTSATITTSKFNTSKVATVNVSLVEAPAKISGTVVDARNGNIPLAGVKVSVSANESAV